MRLGIRTDIARKRACHRGGVNEKVVENRKTCQPASLTHLNARYNSVGDEGKAVLQEAVKDKVGFKLEL